MKWKIIEKNGQIFLVPKVVDIEKYPFAYRKELPREPMDVEELIYPLPVKPYPREREVRWRELWKTRRKQLKEEPGWSERETYPTIGKERWKWDWAPGQKGYRTEVLADIIIGPGETIYLSEVPRFHMTLDELKKNVDYSTIYELLETVEEGVWIISRTLHLVKYKMPKGYYYSAGEDEKYKYFKAVEQPIFFAVEKGVPLNMREIKRKKFLFF